MKEKGTVRKWRFGDRFDGRRLRTLPPYNALMPYIMKTRSGSSNSFTDSIEITETEKFLRSKRINGYPGMGFLHLFIAAYIKVAAEYPAVNRFVSGKRVFARNSIEFIMTVKKGLNIKSPETSIKVAFDPRDTIYDVYGKLNSEIEKVKNDERLNDTDSTAKTLMKMPRMLLKFVVRFLDILDYFGKLPKSLLKVSPFHGSVIITDLGSIGLPPVYHHLYEFGNLPVFIALGAKRKVREITPEGTAAEKKYIDFNLVMDERICDGFYFSQVIKIFKNYIRKPQPLETPAEKVVEDVE